MPGTTIWLVGMMGAGKTLVGPRLAQRLGRPFVDTDSEVESEARASVAEIFAREGEDGFRTRERAAIERAARRGAVVALGGGAIAQPGMSERLASLGRVVYLRAKPETLLARIGDAEARPLLRGLDAAGRRRRLAELLAERAPHYETATWAFDTDGASVDDVVDVIAQSIDPSAREAAGRRSVRVALGELSYDIQIGSGLLERVGPELMRHSKATSAFLVTVPALARRYAPALLRGLREAGLRVGRAVVKDGDSNKSLRAAAALYEDLLDFGADRSTVLVVLGGGTVGDLVGFVAATWLRGVPFVQVPTTLLAMVDSSIGGKTGVNLPRGKNLVGAFHQPRGVWIDLDVLRSLPARERAAGLAEVVKAGAIWDGEFFARLERDAGRLLTLEAAALLPAIERACAIKAEVVARDVREANLRMLLNFGHTLGHAIEALSRYRALHGEAVSAGMAFAARRSEDLGLAPEGTAAQLEALLRRLGLPTERPSHPRRAYLRALRVDKKRQDARIQFVALRRIGRAETVPLTPEEILPAGF